MRLTCYVRRSTKAPEPGNWKSDGTREPVDGGAGLPVTITGGELGSPSTGPNTVSFRRPMGSSGQQGPSGGIRRTETLRVTDRVGKGTKGRA